ncbi:MAG: DsrE family protein [Candidatus Dormibacteria bacterium]
MTPVPDAELAQSPPWRAVIHLDEAGPDRQRLALGNVANLLDDRDPAPVTVEVVANGPGVGAVVLTSPVAVEVGSLLARGVAVLACANSLRSQGIAPSELLEGVGVVPAGISHLVRRQLEGWAYVRP